MQGTVSEQRRAACYAAKFVPQRCCFVILMPHRPGANAQNLQLFNQGICAFIFYHSMAAVYLCIHGCCICRDVMKDARLAHMLERRRNITASLTHSKKSIKSWWFSSTWTKNKHDSIPDVCSSLHRWHVRGCRTAAPGVKQGVRSRNGQRQQVCQTEWRPARKITSPFSTICMFCLGLKKRCAQCVDRLPQARACHQYVYVCTLA